MDQEVAFLQAVLAERWEVVPQLIYADWLEERGDLQRAEYLRVRQVLRSQGTLAERYDELSKRREVLRAEIEERSFTLFGKPVGGKVWLALLGEPTSGVVTRVEDHGVFIDLGGVEGLVHVSDMCW